MLFIVKNKTVNQTIFPNNFHIINTIPHAV